MNNDTSLGLRIDVDTLRGTRHGVPALLDLLSRYGIRASFFFSVGPDNMGRNLWRLLRPSFLKKMIRSSAASLYGWDILFMGTFFPGPLIGKRCPDIIHRASGLGHDIGLHAWDHYTWQNHILGMPEADVALAIQRGFDELTRITGRTPSCSAAPGWIADGTVLRMKDRFPFTYNSDCRGTRVFMPEVSGKQLRTPQVPVTLPTYDEIIGRDGVTRQSYNARVLALVKPGALNVLTIHAEVEGIVCLDLFEDFIQQALGQGIRFIPLSECVSMDSPPRPARIALDTLPGRSGKLAVQVPDAEGVS